MATVMMMFGIGDSGLGTGLPINSLLMENGDFMLAEDGLFLIQE